MPWPKQKESPRPAHSPWSTKIPTCKAPNCTKKNCAGCHNYLNREQPDPQSAFLVNKNPTAPNLFGIGSRQWIEGMLDPKQVASPDYFGYEGSPFAEGSENTEMVDFVRDDCFGGDLAPEKKSEIQAALKKSPPRSPPKQACHYKKQSMKTIPP